MKGLAPDGGLYMPEAIPSLPTDFFRRLPEMEFHEIALTVASSLLGNAVPRAELERIVRHAVAFEAPVVPVDTGVFAVELFHGPTLAFKDFGARFMSQLLGYFARSEEKEIVILVATSGDTGSAVANGFHRIPGTRVVVLYPSGKVSELQEKQFTTLGDNITAVEVDGTFDDCQRLVKTAFQDDDLCKQLFLTSANSINIARLIPQAFYYFRAIGQISVDASIVIAVPSGNFGNLTAGLIAKKMGLPVDRFVIATNANDVVPEFLKTKEFRPRPSIQTISNAMDVGNPSNFYRLLSLYDGNVEALKRDVVGYAVTEDETRQAIADVYRRTGYVMDPHGAVAFSALMRFLSTAVNPHTGLFLETAHPAKFPEVVEPVIGSKVQIPDTLSAFLGRRKQTITSGAEYTEFRAQLLSIR